MTDQRDIDGTVDDIIATCDGDLRGAVKALLLVNEQLERELSRVTALATQQGARQLAGFALH